MRKSLLGAESPHFHARKWGLFVVSFYLSRSVYRIGCSCRRRSRFLCFL